MRATWNGPVLAESDATVVVEGSQVGKAARQIAGRIALWRGVKVGD